MKKELVIVIVELCFAVSEEIWRRIEEDSEEQHHLRKYKTYTHSNIPRDLHGTPKLDIQHLVDTNPVAATLLLSSLLHLPAKYAPPNHPELLPLNPFVALLLSQYGRYVPHHGGGRGLYAYAAANNYHNNKPFGAYKIYEDGEKR